MLIVPLEDYLLKPPLRHASWLYALGGGMAATTEVRRYLGNGKVDWRQGDCR